MMRSLLVLTRHGLRRELRRGDVLLLLTPFAAVALLIAPMALGAEARFLERIGPGLYWVIIVLFGGLLAVRPRPHTAMQEAIRLTGVDPAIRLTADVAVSTVLLVIFEAVIGVVMILLYDPSLTGWAWFLLVASLFAVGMALIGTIAAGAVSGSRDRPALAPLLAIPVAVPLLLGAAQATEGLRNGAGILRWILLLAIVDVALALVGVLGARTLEES